MDRFHVSYSGISTSRIVKSGAEHGKKFKEAKEELLDYLKRERDSAATALKLARKIKKKDVT